MKTSEIEGRLAALVKRFKHPLTLERWSPGDGWTRYRVRSGDYCESVYMSKQELESFLRGFEAAYDWTWRLAGQKKED